MLETIMLLQGKTKGTEDKRGLEHREISSPLTLIQDKRQEPQWYHTGHCTNRRVDHLPVDSMFYLRASTPRISLNSLILFHSKDQRFIAWRREYQDHLNNQSYVVSFSFKKKSTKILQLLSSRVMQRSNQLCLQLIFSVLIRSVFLDHTTAVEKKIVNGFLYKKRKLGEAGW